MCGWWEGAASPFAIGRGERIKGASERGEGGDKAAEEVAEANEAAHCCDRRRLVRAGHNAVGTDFVSQVFDFPRCEDAFGWVDFESRPAQALEACPQVPRVFCGGGAEDGQVVKIAGRAGEAREGLVHEPAERRGALG